MAKDIKKQLWQVHENDKIPELRQSKVERDYQEIEKVKLPNPAKKAQLVLGLVSSCEKAWKCNLEQKENSADEITVDVSSLWKVCEYKKDIYKLANNLQYQIHVTIPNVYAKVSASCEEITVLLINKASMQPPFVEEWLTSKVNQKQTELTFDKLESFYKTQPAWVQRTQNFIKFIKNLFEKIRQKFDNLLGFKIDKQEKKVILQYA